MDYLSLIKQPISSELADFVELFNHSLDHIRKQGGKRMRPMLILLMAKNFGEITGVTQHAAVGLELLHTASLVHDDVVDESGERRGQASVNAVYDNKVSVLVGDYILSTALLYVSYTRRERIVRSLAQLGRTLSDGEILQLSNIQSQEISEEVYYSIIKGKTAALFEACAAIGAEASGASEEDVEQARKFGQNLGIIFQIRDDIFDYYDSKEIGKPTGNEEMIGLARKVKSKEIKSEEIARLVTFTKENGGIEYADKRMWDFHRECRQFIDAKVSDPALRCAFEAYLDFVIERRH